MWRTAPGFLVLAREGTEVLTVTGPGADVWELLAGEPDEGSLVRGLADRYGVPAEVVQRDLVELLDRLRADGHVVG